MRLFVALDLPWMLRERLSALAGAGIPGARWVPPDNYHLTLRFIGETQATEPKRSTWRWRGCERAGFP